MSRTHWVSTRCKQKKTWHERSHQEDNRTHGTQANTNNILGITVKNRVRIAGNQSMCPKKRERGFNQNWHLIGFIGVCVLASEKARWASVERTGPNIMSFLHMEIERWHPPNWSFKFHDANTSICICGPSLKHIASFAWCGTNFGKMRISGFELRQAEVQNRDCKYLSCETCYLVCMMCDSRGFSLSFNSQFPRFSMFRRYSLWAKAQASMKHIIKIPYWTLRQNNSNDQVTEKMASPRKRGSTTPNTEKRLYNRRHSLWWERVGFIWARNSTNLCFSSTWNLGCVQRPLQKLRKKLTVIPRREAIDKFHVTQSVHSAKATNWSVQEPWRPKKRLGQQSIASLIRHGTMLCVLSLLPYGESSSFPQRSRKINKASTVLRAMEGARNSSSKMEWARRPE